MPGSTRSLTIAINLLRMKMGISAGVPHYVHNLIKSFLEYYDDCYLYLIIDAKDDVPETLAEHPSIHLLSEEQAASYKFSAGVCELLAHHFLKPATSLPSVYICFDLHIIDVPWKYQEAQRKQYFSNMKKADAIVTPFLATKERLPNFVEDVEGKIRWAPCPRLWSYDSVDQNLVEQLRCSFKPSSTSFFFAVSRLIG